MALSTRRHGSKLVSRTLKSLSGFINNEERSYSPPALSDLAQPHSQNGALGKALLRSFWAGSWKPSSLAGCVAQQQSYSSIIYPPVEAKVGKEAPGFTAPGKSTSVSFRSLGHLFPRDPGFTDHLVKVNRCFAIGGACDMLQIFSVHGCC